jgi:hypothetical protein
MAKKKTAPKISVTEFTPEAHTTIPTREQELIEQQRKKVKGFIASVDRELDRLSVENGVRIGDTVLNEIHAVELFTETLKALREVYVQSI